jgi:Protein of unknown function (DUF1566)
MAFLLMALGLSGCNLSLSHKCQTTPDCLTGVCVAGECRPSAAADASTPDGVAESRGLVDAPVASPEVAADVASLDSPSSAPDAELDAPEADAGPASTDAGDDAGAGAGAGEPRVSSACPAWPDWPMPSPVSLTGIPGDPQRNLPNAQSYDTGHPDIVIDNVTHLVWQRTMAPAELTWTEAQTYCAALVLDGQTGWRVPSRIELVSLIDFSQPQFGNVSPTAFPGNPKEHVWTCSEGPANPLVAWFVDFSNAGTSVGSKYDTHPVRCVNGAGGAVPPPARYDTTTPGQVRDLETLLTWRADPIPPFVNWGQAFTYCQNLGAGWRLPTLTELQTLIDQTRAVAAVDAAAFPGWADDFYWTSSYFDNTPSSAWFVSMGMGNTYWLPTSEIHRAACVR